MLVFTRFTAEAEMLAREIPDSAVVSADTTKSDRERILAEFKAGKIKVVANVGVLTTGFDYPELDTRFFPVNEFFNLYVHALTVVFDCSRHLQTVKQYLQ